MTGKYLITGGSGKLGTALKKHLKGKYPTHYEFDITNIRKAPVCDLIVHLAGYTDVDKAEIERAKCFKVNVLGTYSLLKHYQDKPFIFISTEHVNAQGSYFQSKLIGELLIKNLSKNYLIIRTIFKPRPWPFEYAFADQFTQGDYTDVIAPLIAEKIKNWNGKSAIVYIGTGRKTMFALAKRTKDDVKPNSVNDLNFKRPKDYLPKF